MVQLAMNGFVAGDLRAIESRAQPVDLIIDFTAAFIQRVSQRRIHAPQLLLQLIKLLAERLRSVLKRRRCLPAKVVCHHARRDKVSAPEEILKTNPVALQRSPRMLFYKRQAGARQNRSCGTIKNSVDLGGLRKVSDLCRAAVVSNRRQQIVLHHGAQSYVWAEASGLALRPAGEFLRGVGIVLIRAFGLILTGIVPGQRMTRPSLIMQEQRERVF